MVISSRTPEGSPNHCLICGSNVTIEPSDPAGDAPCPQCGHLLWFTCDDLGDSQVIRPTGAVLHAEDLGRLVDQISPKRGVPLVLDLGQVQYMSSAVLGRLIDLKKKVEAVRGKLKIANLPPELLEIFRITRLDQVFDVGT